MADLPCPWPFRMPAASSANPRSCMVMVQRSGDSLGGGPESKGARWPLDWELVIPSASRISVLWEH